MLKYDKGVIMEIKDSFGGQLTAGLDGTVYVDHSPVNGLVSDILRRGGVEIDDLYHPMPEVQFELTITVKEQENESKERADQPE
jgi:hypothetical protein